MSTKPPRGPWTWGVTYSEWRQLRLGCGVVVGSGGWGVEQELFPPPLPFFVARRLPCGEGGAVDTPLLLPPHCVHIGIRVRGGHKHLLGCLAGHQSSFCIDTHKSQTGLQFWACTMGFALLAFSIGYLDINRLMPSLHRCFRAAQITQGGKCLRFIGVLGTNTCFLDVQ